MEKLKILIYYIEQQEMEKLKPSIKNVIIEMMN
jgi:hypothetical protein